MNACEYCGTKSSAVSIETRACRCGRSHKACPGCWRWRAKVVGEFPDQDYKLSECPPKIEVPK